MEFMSEYVHALAAALPLVPEPFVLQRCVTISDEAFFVRARQRPRLYQRSSGYLKHLSGTECSNSSAARLAVFFISSSRAASLTQFAFDHPQLFNFLDGNLILAAKPPAQGDLYRLPQPSKFAAD